MSFSNRRPKSLRLWNKHLDGYAEPLAVVYNVLCPTRASVPEREDEVGVFNDGNIATKRGATSVFIVFRQKFRQLNVVGEGILSCAGVHASRTTTDDFCYAIRQIFSEVIYLQISGTHYRYLNANHSFKKIASILRHSFAISTQDYSLTI